MNAIDQEDGLSSVTSLLTKKLTCQFTKAIEKYLASETLKDKSSTKGAIAKIVNSSTEANTLEQVPEVLAEFDNLPEWLKNRFSVGALYREGDRVFGWYRENQVQAEVIPVDIPLTGEGEYLRVLANGDGCAKPTPLPLDGGVTVAVPHEETFLYAKHGWANACPLQWHQNEEGYIVDRSIIDPGF
jgi:hypothetical protein